MYRAEVRREAIIPSDEIVRLLRRIVEILEENYPRPEDELLIVADTYTAYAGFKTVITWEVYRGYTAYIKELYADAISDTTYKWVVPHRAIEIGGNEARFGKILKIPSEKSLRLEVSNYGTVDRDFDVLIVGWARRFRGEVL